jgi:hypothetical protein
LSAQSPRPRGSQAARRSRGGRRGSIAPQFNARATPETVEAFYAIADQQGWLVSEALEQALAALKRDLAGQGKG